MIAHSNFKTFYLAGKTHSLHSVRRRSPSPTIVSTKEDATESPTMKRCRQEKPKTEPSALGDIEDIIFSREEIPEIRASLLKWYDENQRDLPWRRISKNGDNNGVSVGEREKRAYAVWVSEVMLQQTRVQTVIDYFNRWMEKWPTIHDLAQADIEEVNELWAGLGYYRRARFLLEGAKMIVEDRTEFPKTVSSLRKVKGIGDYTAGAIASIAFNETVPVVDGNVIRVIARLKALSANPKDSKTVKNVWKLAGQLVDPSRPGDFNQALMELGATVCTPLGPSCSACPISHQCRAVLLSTKDKSVQVTHYPMKVVKAKQRRDFSAVSVVEIVEVDGSRSDSRFLLIKRPDNGLLAGLWEFPSVLLEGETDLASRRKAINNFLKESFGLDIRKSCKIVLREEVGEYVHVFSHIRLKMCIELLILNLKGGMNFMQRTQECVTLTWKFVDGEALSSLGLTSGVRKVCTMVEKFKQNRSDSVPAKTRKKNKEKTAKEMKC
ncbi:A/G-specific adenine DNA glycosylase [Abeliophyllum distichum]|uniref:Adenine DNA glycosylase n=1 Tax=Abeliophyllum distichum TaxID=126358 RepID=A0ABD1Q5F1_9LAMI